MAVIRKLLWGLSTWFVLLGPVAAESNLLLVTIDGLRWQEVFRGPDTRLLGMPEYNALGLELGERFDSPAALLPFLHETLLRQGSMIGNRDAGSCAQVTNPWYFSYPGYNEILSGRADPAIDTNAAVPNPNVTVLEWLQQQPRFAGRIAAFASWNVFPAILNTARSGIPVNVGRKPDPANATEALLSQLHEDIPAPWPTVRNDAFTHHYALSQLATARPRVLYIAYGETDDFAHDGHYDQYLLAAHRTDRFLAELWDFVQSDPDYRDNTVLFVTVDHGRGEEPLETWQHHASAAATSAYLQSLEHYPQGIVGSDAVWMAALGPGIAAQGVIATTDCAGSNQIAATLLQLLGLDSGAFATDIGLPLEILLAP